MNYYDYRSYFQDILSDLDRVLGNQSSAYSQDTEILTELKELHEDTNERLDKLQETLESGFNLLGVLLVASVAIKVMFK